MRVKRYVHSTKDSIVDLNPAVTQGEVIVQEEALAANALDSHFRFFACDLCVRDLSVVSVVSVIT